MPQNSLQYGCLFSPLNKQPLDAESYSEGVRRAIPDEMDLMFGFSEEGHWRSPALAPGCLVDLTSSR